jgi:glycine hydroxymethyltransferase
VDLSPRGLAGAQVQGWLGEAGIVVNKNVIPFDPRPPIDPSGIRLGTPSITSRGAREAEARQVVRWIHRVLSADDPAQAAQALRPEVLAFCRAHPLPD